MELHGKDTTLQHLNNSVMVAVDIQTTGPYAGFHDLVEIAIIPLDAQLRMSKLTIPFTTLIKPKRKENIDPGERNEKGYAKMNQIVKAQLDGMEAYQAVDALRAWFLKFGFKKPWTRLFPLGFEWTWQRDFLIDWLGRLTFDEIFDWRYRDLIPTCLHSLDRCDFNIEKKKYWQISMRYICRYLNIERTSPYDCMNEANCVAACYREMMKERM